MPSKLSIAEAVADLEAQIVELEAKESHHAEQEALHREQRAAVAEKLAGLRAKYEAFRTAASEIGDVVREHRPTPEAPAPSLEDADVRTTASKLTAVLISVKPEEDTFTASSLAGELNRRYPKRLGHEVDRRAVSMALRRLLQGGYIQEVEAGRPFHEAVYSRQAG